MLVSRGLWIWVGLLAGIVVVVGSSLRGGASTDDFPGPDGIGGPRDRREAAIAVSNIFIGQVVGEQLMCLTTSAPGSFVVYDQFQVKVERNVKGRAVGTVLVWQTTDDTVQYGRDGRLASGRKYLLMTRWIEDRGVYQISAHDVGYALIDDPEERAELVAEVEGYIDVPPTPTSTDVPPKTRATWDAQSTRNAATWETYPTPFPCGPEIVATATASADQLTRDNRGLGGADGTPRGTFPMGDTRTPVPSG